MALLSKLCTAIALIALIAGPVHAASLDELYSSTAIVTGKGEKNRQPGFRDCFDRVLVKVSGDPRLPALPTALKLRERAGDFVASYTYRDRLEGTPIHDEQGTYDRPHDLTCNYEPEVLDQLLTSLGSKPWLAERPKFLVLLDVERGGRSFMVTLDRPDGADMRESFANAARPLGMSVIFPGAEDTVAGVVQLSGTLRWSDADLGWVATWRITYDRKDFEWVVRGVNFDEAFRVAIRGAAQILSGNGAPE
jgi:uncharacterized protein